MERARALVCKWLVSGLGAAMDLADVPEQQHRYEVVQYLQSNMERCFIIKVRHTIFAAIETK
jgi:hypothetical protein